MKKTLLQKAREVKVGPTGINRFVGEGEFELLVAFIKGEVTNKQVSEALGQFPYNSSAGSVYCWVVRALKQGYERKKLRITLLTKQKGSE